MSFFVCACGETTYESEEAEGTSLVAHTFPALERAESSIADQLAAQRDLPRDEIEAMVGGALIQEFVAIFRCPHCGRVAMKTHGAERWEFFRPDQS